MTLALTLSTTSSTKMMRLKDTLRWTTGLMMASWSSMNSLHEALVPHREDAMDVDKGETATQDDAGALDDIMVIEEPETGHTEVEDKPEESKMPEIVEATAGGDPVPDVAEEIKDDTDKSKEVIDVDSTVTAEGTKLAGRPADRSEPASSWRRRCH